MLLKVYRLTSWFNQTKQNVQILNHY